MKEKKNATHRFLNFKLTTVKGNQMRILFFLYHHMDNLVVGKDSQLIFSVNKALTHTPIFFVFFFIYIFLILKYGKKKTKYIKKIPLNWLFILLTPLWNLFNSECPCWQRVSLYIFIFKVYINFYIIIPIENVRSTEWCLFEGGGEYFLLNFGPI